nr:uncharacterized protein LOC109999724 isoform X2 [Labrus bergylta]XP_029137221.1 uncharacterized protein LOC109999724 isoform X1 [Labrus bergylta]XP_029137222.1 uncharacterized protein LOC109999724 isoform X1 [Labrus bergylta]XP_029137223.1 uncharacterized protein LOC109999724 isoform X2 [Labrus bergylta]
MTEQKNGDEVTLICSVSTFDGCRQTVKWLFQNKDVEEHRQGVRTSDSPCTASVTVPTYLEIYKSRYKSLECKVSVGEGGQLFPFKLQPSDENPGEVTTATIKSTTPNEKSKTETDTTETGVNDSSKLNVLPVWQWVLITVAVLVVIALVIIVVKIIRRKRTAGNKSLRDDGATAPEDGVTYSSIKINEKKKGQAQVQRKKDADEGAEVTYSTLKASSADSST